MILQNDGGFDPIRTHLYYADGAASLGGIPASELLLSDDDAGQLRSGDALSMTDSRGCQHTPRPCWHRRQAVQTTRQWVGWVLLTATEKKKEGVRKKIERDDCKEVGQEKRRKQAPAEKGRR